MAGDNIRVNSVHPEVIDTPIWSKILLSATGAARNNAPIDQNEVAKSVVPLGGAGSRKT
jgi:NAD(P)-dependent dehydrogenase (short-subunit alcohol dehydrogenase family)